MHFQVLAIVPSIVYECMRTLLRDAVRGRVEDPERRRRVELLPGGADREGQAVRGSGDGGPGPAHGQGADRAGAPEGHPRAGADQAGPGAGRPRRKGRHWPTTSHCLVPMARESCRIAPPSGLRVNRKSAVPVHVQLPTVRQLAGFLRINPNTVTRALANLERDGYVEGQQGRGTFVADRPTRECRAAHSLARLVSESLTRARRLGFTQDEFVAALASSGPTGQVVKASRQRAVLVECNDAELARYRDELEAELPLHVDRMLVEEFEAKAGRDPGFLKSYRVIITTFFHIHEVKRRMPVDGPPVVALLAEASIKTLLRLTELPEGSTVGLVCTTATGGQNLLRSVQSAGLLHVTPVLASTDDPWSLDRMLERTRTVMCSEQAAERIRPSLPNDVELIVADRTLDRGGIELLRDLLLDAESAHRS